MRADEDDSIFVFSKVAAGIKARERRDEFYVRIIVQLVYELAALLKAKYNAIILWSVVFISSLDISIPPWGFTAGQTIYGHR